MRTMLCFLLSALSCSAQLFGTGNAPYMARTQPVVSGGGSLGSPGVDVVWTTNASGTSTSWSMLGSSGANVTLYVYAWYWSFSPVAGGFVTWGGANMTQLGLQEIYTGGYSNAVYYLQNPASGVQTLALPSGAAYNVTAVFITNTVQTAYTPTVDATRGVLFSGSFSGDTNTLTTASGDGALVLWGDYPPSSPSYGVPAGETIYTNSTLPGSFTSFDAGGAFTTATGVSTSMSWWASNVTMNAFGAYYIDVPHR